jgi:hypothetical protein
MDREEMATTLGMLREDIDNLEAGKLPDKTTVRLMKQLITHAQALL